MQPAYLALLLLMGMSFLLQLQWLFLLSAVLFIVLLFSESYGGGARAPQAMESTQPPAGALQAGAMQAPTQPPIVVVTGGGGLNQSEQYLTTMTAMYSAMNAYQQEGQASPYAFLSRGSVMRQNMFGHHGAIPKGQAHQGLKRNYSDTQVAELTKRMDKLIKKMDAKT